MLLARLATQRPSTAVSGVARNRVVVRTHVAVQAAAPQAAPKYPERFPRPVVHQLRSMLARPPHGMIVVDGPVNCGKSAVLHEAIKLATGGDPPQPCIYIDMRSQQSYSAEALAQLIAGRIPKPGQWPGREDLLSRMRPKTIELSPQGIRATWDTAAGWTPSTLPLSALLDTFAEWSTDVRVGETELRPVVVIDEATILRHWESDYERQGLINWIVQATKQESLCHVVMATSDCYFYCWLERRVPNRAVLRRVTLGNLSKEDAYAFLVGGGATGWAGYIGQLASKPWREGFGLPGSMFEKVHDVCGGNFGALQRVVDDAHTYYQASSDSLEDSWQSALDDAADDADNFVDKGFLPRTFKAKYGQLAQWSPGDWAVVLHAIADAKPHYTVPYFELKQLLGQRCGSSGDLRPEEVLDSLQCHNMVAVRSYSKQVEDLPNEAFKSRTGRQTPVVTAVGADVLQATLRWAEAQQR